MGKKSLLLTFLLVLSLSFLPVVRGGSLEDPELTDSTNDSDHQFRDIMSVWIDNEDNASLRFNMKMSGEAPPWERGMVISGQPTYDYEIYFTCRGHNYSIVREIQVAISSPIPFVFGNAYLRLVEYDNETGGIAFEGNGTAISDYDFDDATNSLWYSIPKSMVGSPEIGDKTTHIWAAIWNTADYPSTEPRNSTDANDVAGSYGNPGRDYAFTGGFEYVYCLSIEADKTSATVAPGGTVSYEFTINATAENPNASLVEVVYFAATNWTIQIQDSVKNVSGTQTFNTILTVKAPATAKNNSKAIVNVYVKMYIVEGDRNATLSSEEITVTTTAVIPPEQPDGGGFFLDDLLDMLVKNMLIVGGVAVVLIVVVIVVAVRKK